MRFLRLCLVLSLLPAVSGCLAPKLQWWDKYLAPVEEGMASVIVPSAPADATSPSFYRALALSPSGDLLAGSPHEEGWSTPGTRIHVVRVATGEIVHVLSGHLAEVKSLSFNRDGSLLASGDANGNVKIWVVRSGELRNEVDGAGELVAFSPTEEVLATCGLEWLRLWDLAGEVRWARSVPKRVFGIDFDAEGKRLAWIGYHEVRVLDAESGSKVSTYDPSEPWEKDAKTIEETEYDFTEGSLAFLRKELLVRSRHSFVRVNPETGEAQDVRGDPSVGTDTTRGVFSLRKSVGAIGPYALIVRDFLPGLELALRDLDTGEDRPVATLEGLGLGLREPLFALSRYGEHIALLDGRVLKVESRDGGHHVTMLLGPAASRGAGAAAVAAPPPTPAPTPAPAPAPSPAPAEPASRSPAVASPAVAGASDAARQAELDRIQQVRRQAEEELRRLEEVRKQAEEERRRAAEEAAAARRQPDPAAISVPGRAAEPGRAALDLDKGPVTKMSQPGAWALVIGIERYRESLPPAEHAENDARAFASYLTRTLGLPAENVRLLVGDRASKGDIEAALEEWLPARAKEGSTVYFFYSGHGAPDPVTGDSYLVPWDAEPAYIKSKGIALGPLYERLGRGRRAVAFVDACFSGAGARSVLPKGTRPLVPVKAVQPKAGMMAVLSASGADQISGAAEGAAHGLFTYHLLRGLSGLADRDGDRAVSLHELHLFVGRLVREDARKANREQVPQLALSGAVKPGDWAIVEGLVE